MPHESGHLHPSMMVNSVVLFMGRICVLPKIIASFLAWTSVSQLTSVLVAMNPFTAPFVPNGVWKVVECGVFIARNRVQNLRIWWIMLISLISVVTGFVVRPLIDLELFELVAFCSNLVNCCHPSHLAVVWSQQWNLLSFSIVTTVHVEIFGCELVKVSLGLWNPSAIASVSFKLEKSVHDWKIKLYNQ